MHDFLYQGNPWKVQGNAFYNKKETGMQNMATKKGYYTVNIKSGRTDVPYVVLACSDYHAARLVYHETGCLPSARDIEGPFARF